MFFGTLSWEKRTRVFTVTFNQFFQRCYKNHTVGPLLCFQEMRMYSKSMTGKREQSAISNKSDSDSDSDDDTFSKTRVRNSIDELAQTYYNYVLIVFKLNRLTRSVWICEAVEDLNLSKKSQKHVSKTLIFHINR